MKFFRSEKKNDEESLPLRQNVVESSEVRAGGPSKLYSYQTTADLSMDDDTATSSFVTNVETTSLSNKSSTQQYLSSTTNIILTTLFTGFCIGFSVAFWLASSYYWQSEEGLKRLGCVRETSNTDDDHRGMNMSTGTIAKLVGGGFAGSLKAEDAIFHTDDEPWTQDLLEPALRHVYSKNDDKNDDISLSLVLRKSLLDLVPVGGGDGGKEALGKTSSSTTSTPNIYMNHIEAYEMLLDDGKKTGGLLGLPAAIGPFAAHYFLLNSGTDVQVNQAYCAAASSAALLNSLRFMHPRSEVGVDIPMDAIYSPYSYATQMDLFGKCTSKNVVSTAGSNTFEGWGTDGITSFPYGMNLEQTAALLRCHLNATAGWTVTTQHVDDTHLTLSKMRFDMKLALSDPSARVIVNYHRASAGQVGSGHFSPVGAYHQGTDSFLILDVARYKYPPVWIVSDILYKAMRTYDQCGDWDFPHAQEALDDRLRVARKEDEVKEAMDVLGCKRSLRGYIIAKRS
mmetsp:Transcript_8122/g.17575  ORF Transcript_8122/g.17575 Transcript_8122/m.17575 type:complete len:510 (+) Transcript_8122:191-1720(+)